MTEITREHVLKLRNQLKTLKTNTLSNLIDRKSIKKVVLILSSSRSGSSLVYEILKLSEQVLTLEGEHTPFYKLHNIGFPFNSNCSDNISIKSISLDSLEKISNEIIDELKVGSECSSFIFQEFAIDLALRFSMQFGSQFSSGFEIIDFLDFAFKKYSAANLDWEINHFYKFFLDILNQNGYKINSSYFDMPSKFIDENIDLSISSIKGPPNIELCIEEPPFLVVKPRRIPDQQELLNKPILLKAPIDAFRPELIRILFPNANIKIIHLTRNVTSTINSLIEGWQNDFGFFSHNLRNHTSLSISNYSEKNWWGKYWWKFDLPPNWETYINQPIEYVCGFQWLSSQKSIISYTQLLERENVLRIKYEDLITNKISRFNLIQAIENFMCIEINSDLFYKFERLPQVMITSAPSPMKWLSRKGVIIPVVKQNEILEIANLIDYPIKI